MAIAILLGVAYAPFSAAEGHWGKGNKQMDLHEKFVHKAKFFKENAKEIGLSEDQVESIQKIKMDTKKAVIKVKADIKIAKLDIKSELYNHQIDVDKVNGLLDQKYRLKNQKAKLLVKGMADLKMVLSDKQYKKAKDIWMDHEKKKWSMSKGPMKCPYCQRNR